MDISEACGNMIVDVGGGTTDIAVLSLGGIVLSKSLRIGGDKFDEALARFIRREYNLMIGERSAEELKIRVGSAYPQGKTSDLKMDIRGRDLVSGLPKTVNINAEETAVALGEPVEALVTAVKEVLERTPPELAADIINRGIVLTGGGSLLDGLDTLLMERTHLPIHTAEDPISCVAHGTGKALTMINVLRNSTSSPRIRL